MNNLKRQLFIIFLIIFQIKMKENKIFQITVTFNFALFPTQNFLCNLNDILDTVIIKYISKINKDRNSLAFLYDAKQIENEDFKKTLNQIITNQNKEQRIMTITVIEKANVDTNDTTIINNNNNNINNDANNKSNNNNNYNINNDNNNNFFNINNNLNNNMNINNNNNNNNNLNNSNYNSTLYNFVPNQNHSIFNRNNHTTYENSRRKMKCCECIKQYKKLIIGISILVIIIIVVIIIYFVQKAKKNDKKSSNNNDDPTETTKPNIICDSGYFLPDDDSTCQKCSLDGCVQCTGSSKSNICTDCGNFRSVIEGEKIIRCNDPNKPCEEGEEDKCLTCDTETNECKECNIAYKLVSGICRPDYFIKAVYLTKQDEDKIDIINNYGDVTHLYVEGKKITPSSTNYQFKKEGLQAVYFQFEDIYFYKSQIFRNNKHLKSITFSDFIEYKMGISLSYLFAGCTNLTSVDFSKLSYIYSSNMEHMFDGCINLTYVNVNNLKSSSSTAYMFNDCKSLTSIDLSNFDISETATLRNMFANCTSLQNINLKGFKLDSATTIESIFDNCYSLKSLDLSAFKPAQLTIVYSAFYNCSSLTSINFLDFYSEKLNEMRYLFFNCSSLKELNLNDFNTKNVEYMHGFFEGCESLTSIIIGTNFQFNNIQGMWAVFKRCHSLKSISFDITVTNKVSDISWFFSDCYSLTSVNLKNFDTSNVDNFYNMFHNCYNLKTIDITNFVFEGSDNLKGMFSGCYSITSIDFSNVQPNYYQFDEIFYDCPNLNFVNFSFIRTFPYWYFYDESYYLFNKNISKSGNLIINEGYYNTYLKDLKIYPPEGWTLNLTN